MKFDVFTLFPEIFEPYLNVSILNKAVENGLIDVSLHNIRDYAQDKHHVTDEAPYGGGGGMVMKPDPIFACVEDVMGVPFCGPLVMLTPPGAAFYSKDRPGTGAAPAYWPFVRQV